MVADLQKEEESNNQFAYGLFTDAVVKIIEGSP